MQISEKSKGPHFFLAFWIFWIARGTKVIQRKPTSQHCLYAFAESDAAIYYRDIAADADRVPSPDEEEMITFYINSIAICGILHSTALNSM